MELRMKDLLLIFIAFLCIATVQAADQAPIPFPALSGPYKVGQADFVLTDSGREEIFTETTGDSRRLLVTLYYPAAVPADATQAFYPDYDSSLQRFGFSPVRAEVKFPAYGEVNVSEGSFPLLVFSPGFGIVTTQYSSLLSELASQGYVVAAIWHPYSTRITPFPGEEPVSINEAGMFDSSSEQAMIDSHERIGAVWVADLRFVVDELSRWNASHDLIAGHLDLDRIGAFGHSFGGAAALQAAFEDVRFDAALNMDGDLFGEASRSGSRVPFLFLKSDPAMPSDAGLAAQKTTRADVEVTRQKRQEAIAQMIGNSAEGSSAQALLGGNHAAFVTDLLFFSPAFPPETASGLIGTVQPEAAFAQISSWVSTFMATHVKQDAL